MAMPKIGMLLNYCMIFNLITALCELADRSVTISLEYKGKLKAKNFSFEKGKDGKLLTEIYKESGDDPKIWTAKGVEIDYAPRLPEALQNGGRLEIAGVTYVLVLDRGKCF